MTWINAKIKEEAIDAAPIRRLALINSQAFSIGNFRGPLIRDLVSHGIQVFALAPDYDKESRAVVSGLGAVPVDSSMVRSGINPLRDLTDLLKLAKLLKELQVDAVFSFSIKSVIYGTLAARMVGIAKRFAMIEGAGYVFNDIDSLLWKRRILRFFVSRLYSLSLSGADVVFMLNCDDKKLFVDDGMVSASKVHLLDGIGLDLEFFKPVPLVTEPITFILVARLLREKGIVEYVEAARLVKARHPKVSFLLVGGVDLNPSSISEAEVYSWVNEGVIEWSGQVSDIRKWLAYSSVFVLPSYYREGLPRSTQEAMALGRPVITTDSPGCRETVENGVNGIKIPVCDSESLAVAMNYFIEQPNLIISMGRESCRIAEERYDVRKINEEILTSMGII